MEMNNKKIWFTSDTHFGHHKDFLYKPRGFQSSEEHDETIIQNWNSVIDYEDEVYHLGDVMLEDNEYGINCLKRLNGKIHIIAGNHDSDTRIELYKQCPNVVEVLDGKRIKIGKNILFLCHWSVNTANYDDDKPWVKHLINIYGHTHQKTKFYNNNPYMYCICLDAHNNFPVLIDDIIEEVKQKKIEMDKIKED